MDADAALEEARRLIRSEGMAQAAAIEAHLSRAEADPECGRTAQLVRGAWYMNAGRYEEALSVAVSLTEADDATVAGQGANLAGTVHLQRGDYAEALAGFEAALATLPESERSVRARVENNLGLLCTRIGQSEAAIEHYRRAADAFADLGEDGFAGRVRANLGIALARAGRGDDARRAYERALDALADDPAWRANVLGSLADLCLEGEQFEEAERLLRQAIPERRRLGQGRQLSHGHLALARALIGQGRLAEARPHLEEGQTLAEDMDIRESLADALEIGSSLCAAEGDFERAYHLRVAMTAHRDALRREELQRRVLDAENRTVLQEARKDAERRRLEAEELRRANEAAKAALRARSEFIATTSHELRGPLTAVIGACELLSLEVTDPSHVELVHLARSSAELLQHVIGEVLELSRLDAGRIELDLAPFGLREVVAEACAMGASAGEVAVEHVVVDAVPQQVIGDASRVQQVLLNLVGNAVKYTDEGSVRVIVDAVGPDRFRFEVRDTGVGIPEAFVPHLFEPFARASDVHQRRGTGLGLAIARRLAVAMGGDVSLVSTGPDGSVFALVLPLQPASTREASVDPTPTEGALRILLIEDDATVGKVIASMLGVLGHEVVLVESAEAADEALSRALPDLVISDHRLPGDSGVDLAGRWATAVRFALLSGEVSESLTRAAEAAGVERVVPKPVTLAGLREVIAGA